MTAPNTLSIPATLAMLRKGFDAGRTRSLSWRLQQLAALDRLLHEQREALCEAVHADFGKAPTETDLTEISFLQAEIALTRRKLRSWLRKRRVSVPLALLPARAWTQYQPRGLVLIIGAWNYPIQLLLAPLIGALAAGNAVVLKPSELAPATSALLAKLVPRYLDTEAVALFEGDAETAQALLAECFDHIFYTGNGKVARLVAEAAAKHLTTTTLELGGKSPAWVDESANLATAADRIVWGKFINAGQTCVAPDYLLCTKTTAAKLLPALRDSLQRAYGADANTSPDYPRIVNERHFQRLVALLDGETPAIGGETDAATRYIAPTVVDGVSRDAALMQDEIFGPILPIVHVEDVSEAISCIRSHDAPLALYVFSNDGEVRQRFETETASGGLAFNVAVAHLGVPGLPFGGVGPSGMGAYHGEHSLRTFSHERSVFAKPLWLDTLKLITPPYTARTRLVIDWLLRR